MIMSRQDEINELKEMDKKTEKPALTHEQYEHMARINAKVRELKQNGYDMREYLDKLNFDIKQIETQLLRSRDEIVDLNAEMENCYKDYIFTPYNLTGQMTSSETGPHYITVVTETKD